jgi:hypothetical protein
MILLRGRQEDSNIIDKRNEYWKAVKKGYLTLNIRPKGEQGFLKRQYPFNDLFRGYLIT